MNLQLFLEEVVEKFKIVKGQIRIGIGEDYFAIYAKTETLADVVIDKTGKGKGKIFRGEKTFLNQKELQNEKGFSDFRSFLGLCD